MHFITKTINFITPEGRGSSYRLAEHDGHRFLVVFDEDMDMRVMFAAKELAESIDDDFRYVDVIAERKGAVTVVFSSKVRKDWSEHKLNSTQRLIELLADEGKVIGDNWAGYCHIWDGYKKPESGRRDFMDGLFYPLNNRQVAIAQLAAALKTARSLTHIEIPGLEVAENE